MGATVRLLTEPFQAPYMQRALAMMLVLGVLAGVVGVAVQLRRLTFMADAMTHTVFPGIAVAFALGQSLFLGALAAAVASAVLLTLASRSARVDQDAFLALLLATFFSVGVVVVSRRASYRSDLTELLFGRVLTITGTQLVETAAVALTALALLVALRKELLVHLFDPMGARALGYPVVALDLVLNVVVALVIVAAVRAVGTALVVALIVIPAATGRVLCRRLGPLVLTAIAVGALGGWAGLVVSYEVSVHHGVNLATGGTIVVVLTATFAVVATAAALSRRPTRRRRPLPTEPTRAGVGAPRAPASEPEARP